MRTCPNCGRVTRQAAVAANVRRQSRRRDGNLSRAQAPPPAELELYDELDLDRTRMGGQGRRKSSAAAPPDPSSSSLFKLDAAELRARIAEDPELVEPGLQTVTDEGRNPVGAGFSTDVGEIDLLARDTAGALVVVMIAEKGEGRDPVADVLQRIGWVRKHMGEGSSDVRGIVLFEPPLDDLSYAAAAVAGTVCFKTYRIALTFEDLEI